ncbi:hypothetical protein [Variovorax guangxiensis]|nr:hypothetical protein [Variovorax guangxiensis]MDR6860418.1 RES domain-containing protein [Variovorax guangxiensis]
MLFPSAANAVGTNLVVYTTLLTAADTLAVNDPHGDLPKDQASWLAKAP